MTAESKKNYRIVVTDSGLGGLSIAASLEYELRNKSNFPNIDLIFFNALAASDFGYNSMPSLEKQSEVFDSALNSIANLFHPDLILIACNTLSVVYKNTKFSKTTEIEVMGIIELGIEMILEEIKSSTKRSILFLGTPTTINSNSYQKKIALSGIDVDEIISQPCPLLESEIQRNPQSEKVVSLIRNFIKESKNKITNKHNPLTAVLGCTHYGYSENIFYSIMREELETRFSIVNPNKKMVETVTSKLNSLKLFHSNVLVNVYSQVNLRDEEIKSIARILHEISPLTANALLSYHFNPDLFYFSRQ